ncbi:MAG: helix-turn-helix domain-containing protein [Myxococcota bacterium]
MGRPQRRERERQRRREEIWAAAERVSSAHGYAGSTMQQIADEAELSKGTLYLHFDSKAALFGSVLEHEQLRSLRRVQEAAAESTSGLARLWKVGLAYCEFIDLHPGFARLLLSLTAIPGVAADEDGLLTETFLDAERQEAQLVREIIAAGHEDETLRPELTAPQFERLWFSLLAVHASETLSQLMPTLAPGETVREPDPHAVLDHMEALFRGWATRPEDVSRLRRA